MDFSPFKLLLFFALFSILAVHAEEEKDLDTSFTGATSYGSSAFKSDSDSSDDASSDDFSSGSQSSEDSSSINLGGADTTPEEPLPPPPTAIATIGPLLSLIQPILGGILNGPSEPEAATYPPLLKPFFSPLPILPGFGVIPATLAAQVSDFVASAAASARGRFANAARENALRSQSNYGHILMAINELNQPAEESESRK